MNWLDTTFTLLGFLTILPGLWIAGKFLPNLCLWAKSTPFQNLITHPLPRLMLWLAVGYLFTLPLADSLGWLHTGLLLLNPPYGTLTTAWGNVPMFVQLIMQMVMMTSVYGILLFLSKNLWLAPGKRFCLFPILTVSSLVLHFVQTSIFQFLSIELPGKQFQENTGIVGYCLGWVTGFFLLGVLIYILNGVLKVLPKR